jgi:hypothetical protein
VIHGAAAHVRVALVDRRVDGGAVLRVARPPALRARNDARPNPIADIGDREKKSARVADLHLVSGPNASRGRIVWMDQQRRRA